MKPWDERIYEAVAVKRSAAFKPLAVILDRIGVTPDMVSGLGVMLAALFIYAMGKNFTTGLWLLFGMLICDQLDGAIARYRKTANERGKFVDVAADTTSFALIMIGLAHAGLVGAATAGAYIYFATAQRVMAAVRKNLNRPHSGWLFYAGAGPLPSAFIYTTYLLYAVAIIAGHDYLQSSSLVFASLLALRAVADFLALRYRT